MKIAVVGGGFTGLAATLSLSEKHNVTLFETTAELGGLAAAVKFPGSDWFVEKHYHHWFTNDKAALSLIKKLFRFKPKTAIISTEDEEQNNETKYYKTISSVQ